jgi:hypothetical protein
MRRFLFGKEHSLLELQLFQFEKERSKLEKEDFLFGRLCLQSGKLEKLSIFRTVQKIMGQWNGVKKNTNPEFATKTTHCRR